MASCDVCQAPLPENGGFTRPSAEMATRLGQGFGPWNKDEREVGRAMLPPMTWPLFVRIMWKDKAVQQKSDWRLCDGCHEAARTFDREAPKETPDALAGRDWLRGILEDLERSGAQPLTVPPLESSPEVRLLTEKLRADLVALPPGKGGTLSGGFAMHGEKYGLAAATILLGGQLQSPEQLLDLHQAAELLAEWDDPRAVPFLVAGLRNPFLTLWIAPLLRKKKDKRALFPALQLLVHLLKLQDHYRPYWSTPGSRVPYKTFTIESAAVQALRPHVPPADFFDVCQSGISIAHLIYLTAELGDEWGRRTLREIYAFSLFREDIICCAERMHSFEDGGDQEAVALAVANQAFDSGINEQHFHARLEYLAQNSSSAGWWAMERFCRAAKHWSEQIPTVRKSLARVPKPSEHILQRLERSYGPFLELQKKSEASGSKCFIASAVYGSSAAAEVAALRDFRNEYLLSFGAGRAVVSLYARLSPPLAEFIGKRPLCRSLVRILVMDRFVQILKWIRISKHGTTPVERFRERAP